MWPIGYVQSFSELQYNFSNVMTDLLALAGVLCQMVMTNAEYGEKYYFLSYLNLFFVNNSFIHHSKFHCGYLALLQSPRECLRYRLESHGYGTKITLHLRLDVVWCSCLTCGLYSEHLHCLCAMKPFGILVKYMDSFLNRVLKCIKHTYRIITKPLIQL